MYSRRAVERGVAAAVVVFGLQPLMWDYGPITDGRLCALSNWAASYYKGTKQEGTEFEMGSELSVSRNISSSTLVFSNVSLFCL